MDRGADVVVVLDRGRGGEDPLQDADHEAGYGACAWRSLRRPAASFRVDQVQRRWLVLLVRETPLILGHLRAMTAATESGAIVMPPVPAVYLRTQSLDDIVRVGRGRACRAADQRARLRRVLVARARAAGGPGGRPVGAADPGPCRRRRRDRRPGFRRPGRRPRRPRDHHRFVARMSSPRCPGLGPTSGGRQGRCHRWRRRWEAGRAGVRRPTVPAAARGGRSGRA